MLDFLIISFHICRMTYPLPAEAHRIFWPHLRLRYSEPSSFLGKLKISYITGKRSFLKHCPFFQLQADSSSTLPFPLKSMKHEAENDGSGSIESAGIFVHEATQVNCFEKVIVLESKCNILLGQLVTS